MVSFFLQGGLLMWAFLGLSLLAATIIIERLLYFRQNRVEEEKGLQVLKGALEKGHFDEALAICEHQPSPITNLMKVGLTYRTQPLDVVRNLITDAANLEIPRMERFLSSLGTIATISPLLGLLGTVLGIIDAFSVLNQMQGVGDPSRLAGGIATALITTVGGIVVAIPATIFYNYLVTKVNHSIIRLETRVTELTALLAGSRQGSSL